MRKLILMVAHEADVAESISSTLRSAGHQVMAADCGVDGILWADRFPPDLILVDAALPDMEGSTILGILRRLPSTAALGIILLKPRGRDFPPQARLERPERDGLNTSELLLEVEEALALSRGRAPGKGDGG
jgi:CheY-like chemotaxis protein